MIRKLLLSIILNSFLISQSTLSGLDSWTHSSTIGLSGGGYLFSYQNECRNAAMLVNSNRLFKLSLIKYPADIFNLDFKKISGLEGWGNLSASNLEKSIKKSQKIQLD